eukprot:CAMPEP_0201592328 /NCGR_PEP_ID=MMETSP0190_2-20130828/190252_1 /ASSEMBLY_ACC=CAM_ASM_000263 /TAXON_ID=37353 /ORGANISM="Rosalina sp." /LENGTH=215 /DNA_ID=CAMNT_0048051049 /DNA_START=176 /DNA_END=823 /DNA_ORIENTATION=-
MNHIQRHNFANWSMGAVKDWMSSKTKQEKLEDKSRRTKKKELPKLQTISSEIDDTTQENINDDLLKMDELEQYDEDALIQETDEKGKIRFQRNVPGKPTIWEGEIIEHLKEVKKTKKGMINFHNWEMTRQAVLLCPSSKKGLMPLKKELKFIFPRAVWGVDVHGGFIEVARKLGLKPHRRPPFYIPYLEPNEQYEFIQQQIDQYNEVRTNQKKMF